MKFVYFTHSLVSDWNHGNAHFLRGVLTELIERGHEVAVYEPRDAWSLQNLLNDQGRAALGGFENAYPALSSIQYNPDDLSLEKALSEADVAIVHEWNDHELVARVGEHRRKNGGYRLFFHDTHHRCVTDEKSMGDYDLSGYDGVLAFGSVIRDRYREKGWAKDAWTWHEAADTRVFRPEDGRSERADVVWIGNWGDEERTAELQEFLLDPVKELGLKATVYGVRYPDQALNALAHAGIDYAGWLPNYKAPCVFAKHRMTVHVPRRPYVEALPGIPTIRMFEALACGIPLISAPWNDSEGLFRPGTDFLMARDGAEMKVQMKRLLDDASLRGQVAASGLERVRRHHTCGHRVDELLQILAGLEKEERKAVALL
ncbi:MAG: hypothetical protein QOJ65_2693 [Fimbriimonadaceae bacterium]|jgi:spore maturation protein CgeB|nr:hypothetical protein [Fimbriimonadaceae bacterium]